jgi:glycosyltransferase involved in cell wall biosynthesis
MNRTSCSVVVTVKNEEASITELLNALLHQLKPVEDLLVVDGGSTDSTVMIVHEWLKHHDAFPLTLIEAPGSNRSAGRNIGVERAMFEVIAVTDAGCVPAKLWLKKITKPFEDEKVDSVAGFYTMESSTNLKTIFSWYLGVLPENFKANEYLPSSRSLAFTKSALATVGGYPEQLDTCEDLVLAADLKKKTRMYIEKDAVVDWIMPTTYREFFGQITGYAKGDMQARYWPHIWRMACVWLRYAFFVMVPPIFIMYWLFPLFKWKKKLKTGMMYQTILVQMCADFGVLWGSLQGIKRQSG